MRVSGNPLRSTPETTANRFWRVSKCLTDLNLKTDISWVRRLTASNPQLPEEFKKFKTTTADFQLQAEDTQQIAGYVEGLKEGYPEAQISQFVIYCFGNQGYRVFDVV